MEMALGSGIIIIGYALIYLGIVIMFLLTQNNFAKAMQTSNPQNNTNSVWIWTQIIPIWSLIAVPVTLIKLNTQFKAFMEENNLSTSQIKLYSNLWGWVWYAATIISFVLPVFLVVKLIAVIGFWIHINNVKNSLVCVADNEISQQPQNLEE